MAKTSETRTDQRNVTAPTAPQICAAMGKAICDVKRDAMVRNVKLAVTSEQSWSVPKQLRKFGRDPFDSSGKVCR